MCYLALITLVKRVKYLRKFFSLFLTLAVIAMPLGGCSTVSSQPNSVLEFIPTQYDQASLIELSRFKVVDDFSSDREPIRNKIGGLWLQETREGDALTVKIAEDEAVAHYGHALKVQYDLASPGTIKLATDLNGLDVSQAQALSFWFAYEAVADSEVIVRLTDYRGHFKERNIAAYVSPNLKNWQEVFIPQSAWRGVDFDSLKELAFIIRAKKPESGEFLLDQISFFGGENVFFESLKDNLKGFPGLAEKDRRKLLELSNEELLRQIARDTWQYFEDVLDKRSFLPVNRVKLAWQQEIGDYASPTDIGLYLLSAICAVELNFISRNEAEKRIRRSLKTVDGLEKWKGFLYNYYSTTNLQTTNRFVSTVDNGWFAASLMVVKAFFPGDLGKEADSILRQMDFGELYDVGEGKFNIGYDDQTRKISESHYGLLNTEARIVSYVAIAKGDVEEEQWFRMFRVLPKQWTWQTQVPEGENEIYRDIHVFEGYYRYHDREIVPSWGGSLFEFLMPTLVVKENEMAPEGLGLNNRIAAEIHRDYACVEKHYPVWGVSPCMLDRGGYRDVYREFGIKEIGTKGYRDRAVITPYASFLALEIIPEDVLTNIRRLLNLYPIYGEYGFYDSVDLRKPHVAEHYLALDQAMILVAITNYLKKGIIREKFHSNEGMKKIESLLSEEKFFSAKQQDSKLY